MKRVTKANILKRIEEIKNFDEKMWEGLGYLPSTTKAIRGVENHMFELLVNFTGEEYLNIAPTPEGGFAFESPNHWNFIITEDGHLEETRDDED